MPEIKENIKKMYEKPKAEDKSPYSDLDFPKVD